MASTMSCGELKNTTFVMNKSDNDDLLLGKVSESDAKDHFNENDKNKVYQVRPGSRIIKLNNIDSYNAFKQEVSAKMNIPIEQITSLESIFKDSNSVYDGVLIGKDLVGNNADPFLKQGGLRIYNEDALAEWKRETVDGKDVISKEAVHEPIRSHFKADGTEVSDDMRKLSSELFNNLDKYKNAIDNNNIEKYDINSQEGKERYDNFNITGGIIDVHMRGLTDERFNFSTMISTENTSKYSNDAVYLSAAETIRIHDTCNAVSNTEIDMKTVSTALAMYQHYNSTILNYNQEQSITNIENELKQMFIASKDGANQFYNPENNTLTAGNVVDSANYNVIASKTAEDMHREKQVWDNVIKSIKPEYQNQFREIAKVHMTNTVQTHVNLRKSESGYINFGDKKIHYVNPKKAESSQDKKSTYDRFKSSLETFRQNGIKRYSEAKKDFTDGARKSSLSTIRAAITKLKELEKRLKK